MPTFLALVQDVARESGTVPDATAITDVTGLSVRNTKLVNWVKSAWRQVQNHRSDWEWMRAEFSGQTVAAQQRYTGAEMSASRFAAFVYSGASDEKRFSIFKTADGASEEKPLRFLDWPAFFSTMLRGSSASDTGPPTRFSIDPAGKLVLWPIPDAAYTVRGIYRKDEQQLTVSADVPEMPARFHDVITYRALMSLATHDEAATHYPLWRQEYLTMLDRLERDQLPITTLSGALA